MLPKDLLDDLEKGDRRLEFLKVDPAPVFNNLAGSTNQLSGVMMQNLFNQGINQSFFVNQAGIPIRGGR